jgi:16S rRNA (adenine1518-N6/adenine1519-N6)-dimethyltransferase
MTVKPKKHLGQHFLTDQNTCQKIADAIHVTNASSRVLEVGPGTGALTRFLLEKPSIKLKVMEVDRDSIDYLNTHFNDLKGRILNQDFLKYDLNEVFGGKQFIVAGNFPYNISSQILFHCIDYRHLVPQITGMFQKELAERAAEKPGSKKYGVLSVLLQAFYDIEYCFTVGRGVFNPPPKVDSGVIRCIRHDRPINCDEVLFKKIVKATFNVRRKTIRNGLKPILQGKQIDHPFLELRPERLSVKDFAELTNVVSKVLC